MDPFEQIDAYCERLGPGLWAEPINAVTNLAFMVAAVLVWRQARQAPLGAALCVTLFLIGVGSGLFHTLATAWSATADVIPILIFVLIYLFAIVRDMMGRPTWQAVAAVVGFFPYAALTVPIFSQLGVLGSSAGYMPIPLGIVILSALMWRQSPQTAKGMLIGVAILGVSLTFRTIDEPLCGSLPIGTHFLWHILNAVMLGWMILVYARHKPCSPRTAGLNPSPTKTE
ncbi:ceramidase domain-containing protein [Actibacterium pelagium]|uniref:Membrane protein n=1 Tax=Actibacterium pelagium TaxID=2029103 RepID=A0A917ADM8_9RHOB|nr:ceramidase domain-containing protein [Actibacterium pelagium]GGE44033.1 membrane protein [Actibacterium pelagium]